MASRLVIFVKELWQSLIFIRRLGFFDTRIRKRAIGYFLSTLFVRLKFSGGELTKSSMFFFLSKPLLSSTYSIFTFKILTCSLLHLDRMATSIEELEKVVRLKEVQWKMFGWEKIWNLQKKSRIAFQNYHWSKSNFFRTNDLQTSNPSEWGEARSDSKEWLDCRGSPETNFAVSKKKKKKSF